MFRTLLGRRRESPESIREPMVESPVESDAEAQVVDELALILDRFCLAHQGSFCSVCVEHCPENGAIVTDQGKPRVVPDLCTGCRICHEVCPAPKNAIFLVARSPKQGMIGKTVTETRPEEGENDDHV